MTYVWYIYIYLPFVAYALVYKHIYIYVLHAIQYFHYISHLWPKAFRSKPLLQRLLKRLLREAPRTEIGMLRRRHATYARGLYKVVPKQGPFVARGPLHGSRFGAW